MKQIKQIIGSIAGFLTFASWAWADTATVPAESMGMGSSAMGQAAMLGVFVVIFYFLILRPQNKRAKEHRQLITGLTKGDEIITTGGLLGKISRMTDDFFVVMIADNIEVMVQKQAIATVLPKGTMKSV